MVCEMSMNENMEKERNDDGRWKADNDEAVKKNKGKKKCDPATRTDLRSNPLRKLSVGKGNDDENNLKK